MEQNTTPIFENINKLIFVQQYDRAEKELDLLAESSGDPLIHLRRIELALKLDKTNELGSSYKKKYDETQDVLFLAYETMCYQFSDTLNPVECISIYQKILNAQSDLAICYYGIAIALESEGKFERAIYNYLQSLKVDPGFYPSYFGLSQIYYHQGKQDQGDHYFYLFESSAPYNVYGNFDTHRKLSQYFVEQGEFGNAEEAVKTLSSWWLDNKGECPREIKIFEFLALSQITDLAGQKSVSEDYFDRAKDLAFKVLTSDYANDGVLYFIAKLFEEYSRDIELSLEFYRKILCDEEIDSELVQKIGGHLLAFGKLEASLKIFMEAYEINPDHPDIRFCLLISRLKISGIDVEDYLHGKDRLNFLKENNGDKVEILALLHGLVSRFEEDPEIHINLAEIYQKLENHEKEKLHIEKLIKLDPLGKISLAKFASFKLENGENKAAIEILEKLVSRESIDPETKSTVEFLQSAAYLNLKRFDKAMLVINKLLKSDPWDLNFLVRQFQCQYYSAIEHETDYPIDKAIRNIEKGVEINEKTWDQFDKMTEIYRSLNYFEHVYVRRKIRFLYADGELPHFYRFLETAIDYNIDGGCYDFIKLINTNFDSPHIYFALGILNKNQWKHEVAIMWFEQAAARPDLPKELLGDCYQEIADCYNWGNKNYEKALEFANLAMETGASDPEKTFTAIAHANIKKGNIRLARKYLEKVGEENIEGEYLKGLLDYRDGMDSKAKIHWKPLLTVLSDNVKTHHIKQEIHKFYFREEDYLKAN